MTSDYRRHLLLAIAALLASCQPARLQVPPPRLAVPSAAVAGAPSPAAAVDDGPEDEESIDPAELVDATGEDQSAVEKLAEAFGAVEVIEEDPT